MTHEEAWGKLRALVEEHSYQLDSLRDEETDEDRTPEWEAAIAGMDICGTVLWHLDQRFPKDVRLQTTRQYLDHLSESCMKAIPGSGGLVQHAILGRLRTASYLTGAHEALTKEL